MMAPRSLTLLLLGLSALACTADAYIKGDGTAYSGEPQQQQGGGDGMIHGPSAELLLCLCGTLPSRMHLGWVEGAIKRSARQRRPPPDQHMLSPV